MFSRLFWEGESINAMGPKMSFSPLQTSLILAKVYLRPQPAFKVEQSEKGSSFPNHTDTNKENCSQQIR